MNVNISGAFVYFTIPILGGIPITQTTVSSFLVALFLIIASIVLGRNLKKRPTGIQVLVEKGVSMIYNLTASAMGEHNAHWAPLMGTIFLSSLLGSYIGLTGFLRSSTADLSCTLVWAVMVSVIIWYNNIKYNGFVGCLKGFTQPMAVMTPMNIISEIAQPISMAFRHFGNVAGGTVISSIIYTAFAMLSTVVMNLITATGWLISALIIALGCFLAYYSSRNKKLRFRILAIMTFSIGVLGVLQATGIFSGVPILSFGIPAVLSLYFDFFSGFIQALVFTLLSMVYISGSLPSEPAESAE